MPGRGPDGAMRDDMPRGFPQKTLFGVEDGPEIWNPLARLSSDVHQGPTSLRNVVPDTAVLPRRPRQGKLPAVLVAGFRAW